MEEEEPLSPSGRLFLRPETELIINCLLGGKHPIDVEAVKAEISASALLRHPRFCSVLVRDARGREYWRPTQVDVDRHVIVHGTPVGHVNDYLADLAVSSPLSLDKPLWELHLLIAHDCAVFRAHHALGDGISLMSLLLSTCRRAADPSALPIFRTAASGQRRRRSAREFVVLVWHVMIFVVGFIGRVLWVKDPKTPLAGGQGVELWPRKLATATFSIQDMKVVKTAVPHATINDVLFGVISFGMSRYLNIRCPNALPEGLQITGMATVNLRKESSLQLGSPFSLQLPPYLKSTAECSFTISGSREQEMFNLRKGKSEARRGNKFGMILLPTYYHKDTADPLQHLRRAKAIIDKKKESLEAHFSYAIGNIAMSLFGPKVASLLNYRIVCNTTFSLSNVVGPAEEITLAGNPIDYIRVNTSSLPHAITMHMLSYAGRAEMQILVAKDIIPDPQLLAKCFEDALLEMKNAALATNETSERTAS